ncbi:hypothetical protein OUZ56_028930 [Daphnia magna]|uniref:Secreted protein n=1 Tax=Daphnia magna TaxID=35525 RepID=A0ABR0B5C2_9CRUS|nr:hypothetical protein OUZ56_028930 [Daphnia magna]
MAHRSCSVKGGAGQWTKRIFLVSVVCFKRFTLRGCLVSRFLSIPTVVRAFLPPHAVQPAYGVNLRMGPSIDVALMNC